MALSFACLVMLGLMLDLNGDPRCDTTAAQEEVRERGEEVECFEGSELQQVVSQILGWPSVAIAAIGAVLAVFLAATGRYGRMTLRLAGAAIVLGGSSLIVAVV